MNLRKVLRIARWEVTKNAGQLDRRTAVVVVVALLAVGALTPLVAQKGVTTDEGIYRVGVAEDSPYHAPIAANPAFAVRSPDGGRLGPEFDLLVTGSAVYPADSRKGQAALAELGSTVEAYNDYVLRRDVADGRADRAAAFPVNVTLLYVEQASALERRAQGGTDPSDIATPTPDEDEVSLGGTSGGSGGTGGTQSGGATAGGGSGGDAGGGAGDAPDVQPSDIGASFFSESQRGTPSAIQPPFPFQSLVLAFAFVLPMNFVIQAYAGSVIDERINYRGELLLVSPVSRGDIIAGKTLPYFGAMVAIAAVTALGMRLLAGSAGGGLVAVAAVVPIALLFLAVAFVAAMFSRSYKELTFVTVAVSVFLTSYAFIPAIFTNVHPIAAISPLTLVVRDLRGAGVPLGDYLFSTTPFFLTAGVLFALGAGVYREEDMFTQRPVHLKALDALSSGMSRPLSALKGSALSIPFVLIAELLAVALLFALPLDLSLPVLLVSIALVEEVAKSLHVYAGFADSTYDRTVGTALVVGALSGAGFFLGEKLLVIAQLVGLPNLELGSAAFGATAGLGIESSPLVVLGLFLAPLVLHAVTASMTALGASRNRSWYAGALVAATLVHAAYNLTVVTTLG